MTFRTTIKILLIATLLFSCTTKRADKDFEEQAYKDAQLLDTTLHLLQNWNYGQRGAASFWSKLRSDSSLYNCSFYPSVDTPKLAVYQIAPFLKDFESDLKIDPIYQQIEFTKIGDTALKLFGIDRQGQDILLASNLSLKKTFPERNPFDTLSNLTAHQP